jgi:hypothetical protein
MILRECIQSQTGKCKARLDAKIHPQLAEDAKFEENRESSSIQP